MSSFRPDPVLAKLGFRPAGRSGSTAMGFRPAGGGAARAGLDDGAQGDACTPAQHAALEQSAFEKGQQAAQLDFARCEQACAVFEEAASALARVSARSLHENRETMLELAAEIARHWLGDELRLDPARYAGPLERALAACAGASAARIRLHPEVLSAIESNLPEWLARWSETLAVEIVADADLAPGGFRIETETQSVDAGLGSLAARLRTTLEAAFAAAAPQPEVEAC